MKEFQGGYKNGIENSVLLIFLMQLDQGIFSFEHEILADQIQHKVKYCHLARKVPLDFFRL